jgi:hypothetical protein
MSLLHWCSCLRKNARCSGSQSHGSSDTAGAFRRLGRSDSEKTSDWADNEAARDESVNGRSAQQSKWGVEYVEADPLMLEL